jgi:hypothetical protein
MTTKEYYRKNKEKVLSWNKKTYLKWRRRTPYIIGTKIKCSNCDNKIIRTSSGKKYCDVCRILIETKKRKERYYQNKKHFIENSRKYQRNHPEKIKEYERTHTPQIRARARERYKENREKEIKKVIDYFNTPLGRAKLRIRALKYQRERRNLIKKGESQLSYEKIQEVYKRDKKCVYCGSKNHLTIEHIIALKKEGKDVFENIVIACLSCNASKKTENVFSWCLKKEIKVPNIIIKLLKEQERKDLIPSSFSFNLK